jgi:response regulator RpfG family c-di-GMP phosphodiesterase
MSDNTNILIVDDELGPRESLKMILNPSYNTLTATNGNNALELIKQYPVDMVTLDLKMPGMNGIEVLKEIKKLKSDIQVIVITGYGTLKSAIECIRLGVFDYITKPFNIPEIISVIKKSLTRRNFNSRVKILFNDIGQQIGTDAFLQELKQKIEKIHINNEEEDNLFSQVFINDYLPNINSYLEFFKVLAAILESKDPYTAGHSERVGFYSDIILQELSPSLSNLRDDLQIAAYLHDIGKLGISNAYIYKNGGLSELEWTIVREHPEKGVELLSPLHVSYNIIAGVKYHHESFDGTGYPEGISGEDIPLIARIITIADTYDAISSERSYRNALSKAEIKKELKKGAGSQFDPKLVELFINILSTRKKINYFLKD